MAGGGGGCSLETQIASKHTTNCKVVVYVCVRARVRAGVCVQVLVIQNTHTPTVPLFLSVFSLVVKHTHAQKSFRANVKNISSTTKKNQIS